MINPDSIPVLYISISIFLSGIAVSALIKFTYINIITRRKDLLPLLFLGVSASLYITFDGTALLYYLLTADYKTTRFFILIRELAPLLFLTAIPLLANGTLILKERLQKLNRIMLWCGIAFSFAIAITALSKPELLTGTPVPQVPGSYRQILTIQDAGSIVILKNVLLLVYMIYAVAVFLYSNIYNQIVFPVNKILIALIILIYTVLSYFYSISLLNNNSGYFIFYYPYISIGITIFILFIIFTLTDILIDNAAQLKKVKTNMRRKLYLDSLLNIPNRNGFIKDLQIKLDNVKISGENISLIFIDIDDFQKINDSFGENVGDEILKSLSNRLLTNFPQEGTLYRIGGDDFVFILKGFHSDNTALSIANKIISSLRNPFNISGISYLVTASLGVIQIPRDGEDISSIISNAYSVIHSAKQMKNTCKVFTKEMVDFSSKRISIVNLLRTCISADQFTLFYQPVMDADGKLMYAESLLRCTNPDPSIGGPDKFIPLMEKAGLMKDIDDMVIRKTFYDMEMRIKKRFNISINLSSGQLTNPSYSYFLSLFAAQQGIEPGQIIFEIVEDTLIENLKIGRETLLKLKEKGFKIAIDDFGKGFSSLSYLSELPVDILKMDMAFVTSVPGDPKKESIAAHIIKLAHSLDLKVVIEGFETFEQFEFFKKLGCDNFQGFYFSHPLPLDKFLAKYLKS